MMMMVSQHCLCCCCYSHCMSKFVFSLVISFIIFVRTVNNLLSFCLSRLKSVSEKHHFLLTNAIATLRITKIFFVFSPSFFSQLDILKDSIKYNKDFNRLENFPIPPIWNMVFEYLNFLKEKEKPQILK